MIRIRSINQVGGIYALLTKRGVKMAGYWPSSFFAFLLYDFVSVHKNAKKNKANIQPS